MRSRSACCHQKKPLTRSIKVLLNERLKDLPVVLDPVLQSGSGTDISNDDLIFVIREKLLPLATIITLNNHEARTLTGCDTLDEAATKLIKADCLFVLITGADEAQEQVENRLYGQNDLIEVYNFEKLPEAYYRSGCILSSAIAVLLAERLNIKRRLNRHRLTLGKHSRQAIKLDKTKNILRELEAKVETTSSK